MLLNPFAGIKRSAERAQAAVPEIGRLLESPDPAGQLGRAVLAHGEQEVTRTVTDIQNDITKWAEYARNPMKIIEDIFASFTQALNSLTGLTQQVSTKIPAAAGLAASVGSLASQASQAAERVVPPEVVASARAAATPSASEGTDVASHGAPGRTPATASQSPSVTPAPV